MKNISFVLPNISSFNRNGRGGLQRRYEIARFHNFDFIEVPADFIKNKTEVQLTGKEIGSVLGEKEVEKLYDIGTPSKKIKYILHTDPSRQLTNGNMPSVKPELRWNDRAWVAGFINMIIAIAGRFEIPPAGIEIHPGGKHNTNKDLIRSIFAIRDRFEKMFNMSPFIVLENRTGQIVSDGIQIRDFWDNLLSENRGFSESIGIVLDIQQLFTVSKNDFLKRMFPGPIDATM